MDVLLAFNQFSTFEPMGGIAQQGPEKPTQHPKKGMGTAKQEARFVEVAKRELAKL